MQISKKTDIDSTEIPDQNPQGRPSPRRRGSHTRVLYSRGIVCDVVGSVVVAE